MPQTPVFGLPTPEQNDLATVPAHMQAMAQQIEAAILAIKPVGIPEPWPGLAAEVPDDYVIYDGRAISRATYPRLFAVLGTLHGAGNGSTTFNVPDWRGRVPVGADMGAARVTSNNQPGQSGGSQSHTLTAAQMPGHSHSTSSHTHGSGSLSASSSLGSHSHSGLFWTNIKIPSSGSDFPATLPGGNSITKSPYNTDGADLSHGHSITGSTASGGGGNTGSSGSGQSHPNMQPYGVCIWIGWTGNVTLD